MPPEPEHQRPHKLNSSARVLSQSHHELIALATLFRATGGRLKDARDGTSAWVHQNGWDKVLTVAAALKDGEMPIPKAVTMQAYFPSVYGVKWERNHIVSIDLSGNGLTGKLPDEITQLRFLTTLKLRNNPNLRGAIPLAMYSMRHLRYCYVDGTRLENVLPFNIAHSFQITQVRTGKGAASASSVTFSTGDDRTENLVRWAADLTEAEMLMVHTQLKKLHESASPENEREQIKCTAQNATGPERAAAATKLQRIYRARIERTKFRKFLHSLVEMKTDPTTGYTYYVNARTGEATWDKPKFLGSSAVTNPGSTSNNLDEADAWKPYDDGNGNTVSCVVSPITRKRLTLVSPQYYWNSVTGESTWEPPSFLSRIHEELCARYGTDKTDEERFELFFRDIDRDGTGEIDQDEFARMCGELGMALSAKQLREVFRELDSSGDGQLDRQEIIAWLTRNYA